ncbi:MAG: hypothetical protein JWN66_3455, partial [Sphingomonas bacterium]|uniref:hypothetical protein n=1 Tax=Sphingomonas bacterium TaxID=1895847 RepID=UPI00260960BD
FVASVALWVPPCIFPASGRLSARRDRRGNPKGNALPRAAIPNRRKTMKQFIPLALACFPLIVMISLWSGSV